MSKVAKCQAEGGVEKCTSPNCPEKRAAVERLYEDFLTQRQRLMGASPVMPIAPIYGGIDDGIRSTPVQTEFKTQTVSTSEVQDDEYVYPWNRPNPVNTPEKFGMEMFYEVSLPAADYSFYDAAILKNDEGYYLSTDSGCSCPTPWENHTIDDFTGPLTAEQVAEELVSLYKTCSEDEKTDYTRQELRNAVVKLRGAAFIAEHPDIHPSLAEEMFAPEV